MGPHRQGRSMLGITATGLSSGLRTLGINREDTHGDLYVQYLIPAAAYGFLSLTVTTISYTTTRTGHSKNGLRILTLEGLSGATADSMRATFGSLRRPLT